MQCLCNPYEIMEWRKDNEILIKYEINNVVLILLGEGNGNPLQCSCLGNPKERGAWRATYRPWSCKESDTT